MAFPAQAENTRGPDLYAGERPPDWVGTVLASERLNRPGALCGPRRGGIAQVRAYRMDGHQLTKRRIQRDAVWTGKTGNAVLEWHRRHGHYVSFAKRPFLVAAWCELERPPTGHWIAQPDGTFVIRR